MDQNKTPLFDAIINYINEDITPFHIPSHKMGRGINPKWKEYAGENIFKMDICEVQGLDDLHQPEGVIKEAQELAAEAWGAERTFFLVNGTSSGIISSICSIVKESDKIIIPRNSHKSVVFGLIISGATPIYIPAEIYKEKGLIGGFDPMKLEDIYQTNTGIKGVFSVSPSYHGICSDMKSLIEITHKHGGVFIADEAHGNHTYFHESLPVGALKLGADISCMSIHKMCGSLTQSSMLHLNSKNVDIAALTSNLQMMQNTSPSYLLEVSLDLARHYMATKGKENLDNLIKLSDYARKEISAINGFEILGEELIGHYAIAGYDPLRLIFSARKLGLEGYELYELLRRDYGIEMEFGDYFYGLCIMGLGTRPEDIEHLITALKDISARYRWQRKALSWDEEFPSIPQRIMTPRQAYFADKENIPWKDSKGRISSEMIVPYPPGIPIVCPGEKITDEVWDYLNDQNKRGRHLHGARDGKLNCINIVKE